MTYITPYANAQQYAIARRVSLNKSQERLWISLVETSL